MQSETLRHPAFNSAHHAERFVADEGTAHTALVARAAATQLLRRVRLTISEVRQRHAIIA